MTKIFRKTGGIKPRKTVFNLSHEVKFTCDMGQLIPVMCEEMIPGDIFKIGNQSIIRFQPLVAPILHEINFYVHYFFVPYRLLWDDWEQFITGGVSGDDSSEPPEWDVTPSPGTTPPSGNDPLSLWDYLGFPPDVYPTGALPLDFPRRAYNYIYNEYYRDENLVTERSLDDETIALRAWEKDYFTSSLPWQQRGTGPALPIAGTTSAVWDTGLFINNGLGQPIRVSNVVQPALNVDNPDSRNHLESFFNNNTVDLSTATTFDIADLRVAFQIQKWMERNARGGVRYTEFLQAHFGVHPRDERLQRPEYIGGSKSPVIISEVLQTSSTDATTPQGNLAGHGLSVSNAYCGKYHASEFGLMMGVMSVMPRTVYQQGIEKQWLRKTRYDFAFPEFVNLSEQAVTNAEIFAIDVNESHNTGIFGYQGRFNEMRLRSNKVVGEMRDTFDYWHLSRQFDAGSPPTLNESFIECNPRKDVFADTVDPGLIVNFGNVIKAIRPLPIMPEPGLIDHN